MVAVYCLVIGHTTSITYSGPPLLEDSETVKHSLLSVLALIAVYKTIVATRLLRTNKFDYFRKDPNDKLSLDSKNFINTLAFLLK